MSSKRGVIQTDATGENIGALTSFRDCRALSGLLAGVSFIAGVAGLRTSELPRPLAIAWTRVEVPASLEQIVRNGGIAS